MGLTIKNKNGSKGRFRMYLNTTAPAPVQSLLLDLYPGAAVAYSLRKLNSSYSGAAIRVRRSNDNAEQDIGFVDNYLDTTSLTNFVGANNGFVVTWYDQSGFNRHLTKTTASNQPQIVSSGIIIVLNTKPTIKFNSSQFLSGTAFSMSELYAFSVLNKYNTAQYAALMRNTPSVGTGFMIFSPVSNYESGVAYFINNVDTNGDIKRSSSKTLPTNQYLENWIYNSTNKLLYENNQSVGVGLYNSNWAATPGFNLGSISYTGGAAGTTTDIQEIILYDVYNSITRVGISNNINSFYSIY